MAHELYEINDGQSMGYAGQVPWHGLGQKISADAPIETWIEEARLNWDILSAPVRFNPTGEEYNEVFPFPNKNVLFRSDNQEPLSIVSDQYKVVQPKEVLEFYRSLIETAGFKMETAGSMFNGKKIWALAKTGDVATIKHDRIESYLLLATSCDGSLATTAQFTSVRVVCNNTLSFAIDKGEGQKEYSVKVPHSREFNPEEVKAELGLVHDSFKNFKSNIIAMTEKKISDKQAVKFLINVMGDAEKSIEEQPQPRRMARIIELFQGGAIGSGMSSSDGTVWGLLNAVTQFADHDRSTRSTDSRLNSAWFGEFNSLKNKAFEEAVKIAA